MSETKTPAPDERLKFLTAVRRRKMAASAHAYVRGSTARFYEWVEESTIAVPEGPPVWICGDCHVGNLGPVGSATGKLAVQIRDLDQTVIGNPAHDLIRLALSLAMAARGSDLPGVTTAHILEHMIEGYESAFTPGRRDGAEGQDDAEGQDGAQGLDLPAPKLVRELMREAAGRSWKHLADERIEGTEPAIPLGKRFWKLTSEERQAVDAMFEADAMKALATVLRDREAGAKVRVLDAAYWRKGCSSLGLLRCAVLLAVGAGKAERHCLMDVKEAVAAAAPRSKDAEMPRDNAERVVEGARHLSPALGGRMQAARLLGTGVFVRELLPQDLKLELEQLSRGEATEMAAYLAAVVGRAHARQMNAADRKSWLGTLKSRRSTTLDAPGWLWESVVELVAAHEAAYLQHCRRFALKEGLLF